MRAPHGFEVGDAAPIRALPVRHAQQSAAISIAIEICAASCARGVVESACQLAHECPQSTHFRLEFVSLLGDLDELRTVLVDIVLEVSTRMRLHILQIVLVGVNIRLRGVGEQALHVFVRL